MSLRIALIFNVIFLSAFSSAGCGHVICVARMIWCHQFGNEVTHRAGEVSKAVGKERAEINFYIPAKWGVNLRPFVFPL